jgi:hypothetical protein
MNTPTPKKERIKAEQKELPGDLPPSYYVPGSNGIIYLRNKERAEFRMWNNMSNRARTPQQIGLIETIRNHPAYTMVRISHLADKYYEEPMPSEHTTASVYRAKLACLRKMLDVLDHIQSLTSAAKKANIPS